MLEPFDISIEGFSGPLDLLCTLVETRQLDVSRIKVSQIVRIYGAFLAGTKRAAAEAVAEFFYMAAGLILEKTRSLLPRPDDEIADDIPDDDPDAELGPVIERYRPYRSAGRYLWELLERESRSFRRIAGDDEPAADPSEAEYDIGDTYFLARVWWGLFERYERRRGEELERFETEEAADWDGFTEAVPDESLIENRIAELEERLAAGAELSLSDLCAEHRAVKTLVVTLLALLEMCRMGRISIEQDKLFGDVRVLPQRVQTDNEPQAGGADDAV